MAGRSGTSAPRVETRAGGKRVEIRRDDPANREVDLVFDNNRLASALYGEFDQNLALIERRLHVDARARGNMVTLNGPPQTLALARRVLESLYDRLLEGHDIVQGDVEGALRMAEAEEAQLPLPTLAESGRMQLARIATRKKSVVARTPMQDAYIRAMDRSELVFGIGPAGTGKTFLAVAFAAAMLERGDVERIILSRPAVEAGERLGFLPGDLKEKVDPYLRPLYDALYDMMPAEKVERGFASGIIEVAPLAFMRGRTLSRAAVILDEAQNATTMQMKMFLTRLGEDFKDDRHRRPDAERPRPRRAFRPLRGDADSGRDRQRRDRAVFRGGRGAASAGAADRGCV